MNVCGITRVRNEALIIGDTIRHFLRHCDRIYLYDDCSQDDTVARALAAGGDRVQVIQGKTWITNRVAEETRHRDILLRTARGDGFEWCLCFDADERLVGRLAGNPPAGVTGYRFRLFDGYLTESRSDPYTEGRLSRLPRMWGPEYRDILMLFRTSAARYVGLDRREPLVTGPVRNAGVLVRHYGKCLSVDHWEETCEYYATYFPKRYRDKWEARKGRAIHELSDFGRRLYTWSDLERFREEWVKL